MGIALGTAQAQTPFVVKNQCMLNPECKDDVTTFSDTLSTSVTWQWNFGDGHNGDAQNPYHTYDEPGTYVVCLVITDAAGCVSDVCHEIQVGEPECNAAFSYYISDNGVVHFIFF